MTTANKTRNFFSITSPTFSLLPLAFSFLLLAGLTTGWPNLARIQFVPALLAGSFGIVLILLVATLLFGRIYCSVVCPMGIFQDVIAWIAKKINRKKQNQHNTETPRQYIRRRIHACPRRPDPCGRAWRALSRLRGKYP